MWNMFIKTGTNTWMDDSRDFSISGNPISKNIRALGLYPKNDV